MRRNNIACVILALAVLVGGCKRKPKTVRIPGRPIDPVRLFEAVTVGDLEKVHAEIIRGVNVNAEDHWGWTALHCAAYYGHQDLVQTLIRCGAHLNAVDPRGETPLYKAAECGHKEIVELLRKHTPQP